MREADIRDSDIPGADPAAVVAQYEPFIRKLAKKYTAILERSGAVDMADLCQVGRLAILQAQKKYDPESGYTFMKYLFFVIRQHMRAELRINPNTGIAPAQLVYLDAPLPGIENEDVSMLDALEDPEAVPLAETLIAEETRNETAAEVRAALNRLKSEKQREVISRVYLDGQGRAAAAEEMGIDMKTLYRLDGDGRLKLRRDWRLKEYAASLFLFHVGVNRFNTTWTSATEHAALWRLEHLSPEPPEPAR